MALRSHLLLVDKLIDLHNTKLRGIEKEFEREMAELADDFGAEREEMTTMHARHVRDLRDIMAVMEKEFTEEELDARQARAPLPRPGRPPPAAQSQQLPIVACLRHPAGI